MSSMRTMPILLAAVHFVPAAYADAPRHFGLCVGIDHYAGDIRPLDCCVNDAHGFKDALQTDATRWHGGDIAVLADAWATKYQIRNELWWMGQNAGPGDVCVYFHSSHGGYYAGTSTYLCTYDGDYSDDELGADLADYFAPGTTVIVVVDACYSAGMFKGEHSDRRGAAQMAPTFAENVMAAYRRTRAADDLEAGERSGQYLSGDIAFMTASDYWETSSTGWHYSQFAGELIAAFDYASDGDGDGQHSFRELYDWAAPRANDGQTAQVYNTLLLSRTIAIGQASTRERASTASCGMAGPLLMMCTLASLVGHKKNLRRRDKP